MADLREWELIAEPETEPHVDDGRTDWLHLTVRGEAALRRHLAASRNGTAPPR